MYVGTDSLQILPAGTRRSHLEVIYLLGLLGFPVVCETDLTAMYALVASGKRGHLITAGFCCGSSLAVSYSFVRTREDMRWRLVVLTGAHEKQQV